MSLTLVGLNARQPDRLWCSGQKRPTGNEQTQTQSRFFQSETLTLNSCCSLDYACGNESVIYFTNLCKPIETYIDARKKHPFASYSTAKHPKHSKLAITYIREKLANFFDCFNTGVEFSSRNNFANSDSFAKVSAPAHNYNSVKKATQVCHM